MLELLGKTLLKTCLWIEWPHEIFKWTNKRLLTKRNQRLIFGVKLSFDTGCEQIGTQKTSKQKQ